MPNIKDVAKEAGVSIATVSRVINKTDTVAKHTTRKVEAAIKKTGFIISASAVSMKKQQSRLIPFFINHKLEKSKINFLINIIVPFLERYGYSIVIFNTSSLFLNKKNVLYALSLRPKAILVLQTNKTIIKFEKEIKKHKTKLIKLNMENTNNEIKILKQLELIIKKRK